QEAAVAACWSPDDEWLMLLTAAGEIPARGLFALEVATKNGLNIPFPFTVNGKPDSRYTVNEGIDWIE
ncbi:MAG TPA: hypothetical protein VM118_12705, partial [Acidobacteriota bacterium]|nr:hypothetical protein [Acidobacteriota bacterium]